MSIKAAALAIVALLSACNGQAAPRTDQDVPSSAFPAADRPVAPIVSSRWSTEDARDKVREADRVMDLAGIKPGMSVADIGAGEGYYTIRLSQRVGPKGRVLAQDVVPAVRDQLAARVYREKLDNVSVTLGKPADAMLPANSFDRILMMHMYHEIEAPYELLWRLRPALRGGGRIVIVDADRPTAQHGTPPGLLVCEMGALGFKQVERHSTPQAGIYVAIFAIAKPRPDPADISACAAGEAR
jgi:ubiquinone/menaquinone biosynthesis C-methylase UbiE